jgi:hypothetical protein
MAVAFATVLLTTLVLAGFSDGNPLSKGDAMKVLFATLFAALLAGMAVMAYAESITQSTGIELALPSADDDKDKDKDKETDKEKEKKG